MKIEKWKVILSALMLMLMGCSRAPKPYAISIDASDVGGLGFFQERAFRKNLEWAIDSVTTFLDQPFKDTLQVIVFEKGYVGGGNLRLILGKEHLTDRNALVFGVTQALTPFQANSFKSAGLALLMVKLFAYREPNYLHGNVFLRKNPETLLPIDSLMHHSEAFLDSSLNHRRTVFSEAGSFYQYLLERGGPEKFREFYKGGLDGIVSTYGEPVDRLAAKWRGWLFDANTTDTVRIM